MNVIGGDVHHGDRVKDAGLVPGVCGVVDGSIHPDHGHRGRASACGYLFEEGAASRTGKRARVAEGLAGYRAGQTGLLRLTWDNGDRTVLVNPNLGGVTLGWEILNSTAEDDLFGHRGDGVAHPGDPRSMREHGVPIRQISTAAVSFAEEQVLNRVYAAS